MRMLIETLDARFLDLHKRSCKLIEKTSDEKLFWKPLDVFSLFSCGDYVLRSAGKVEQTFGGITSRLWDDPFEWTLPEELSTKKKILEYLDEVENTRHHGFGFFISDEDLKKELPAPEELKTIFELLIETLVTAEHLQGRGATLMQLFSKESVRK